jgi:hypothetical protein
MESQIPRTSDFGIISLKRLSKRGNPTLSLSRKRLDARRISIVKGKSSNPLEASLEGKIPLPHPFRSAQAAEIA